MNKEINEQEHPFPNEELNLLMKLHKDQKICKEDIEILSNLLVKYLNLRADVFHEF